MHQRTMLKREWRRTFTNSFSPPTARGRQEISKWPLVIWMWRWVQTTGTGRHNQWERWNVLWLLRVKWACYWGNTLPTQDIPYTDGTTENQIDHVAINKTWRSSLQGTRAMRSADAGSDHHLVVAVIKMKLLALKKPSSSRKKYCTYRFNDQTVRRSLSLH